MATINGSPVNFGFISGTDANQNQGLVTTSLSGILLQSADQSKVADMESARNPVGEEVAHGHYNIHDEATLEFIVTGSNLAGAITNTTFVNPGSFVSISTCSSMPSMTGNWEVQSGPKISKTNTGFAKISLPLKKFTNITAVAS